MSWLYMRRDYLDRLRPFVAITYPLTCTGEMVYPHIKPVRGGMNMQGYCVKCRAKREIKDARAITMKNGRPATQGTCPVCGTKMYRIGKS